MKLTMICTIVGALFSGTCTGADDAFFLQLCAWRFLLGVGVGGVYPLAATISSESADTEHRGRNSALVFSMQGVGQVLSPVMAYLIWDVVVRRNGKNGWDWRLLLGIGALPGLLIMPFKGKETAKLRTQSSQSQLSSIIDDDEDDIEKTGSDVLRPLAPANTTSLTYALMTIVRQPDE
jgi:MFS family permease